MVGGINLQRSGWRRVENTWYTLLLIQSVLYSSLRRKTRRKKRVSVVLKINSEKKMRQLSLGVLKQVI